MDICELSEQAEFIANKRHCLAKHWRKYCNTLTQGITLAQARLHHVIQCNAADGLHFHLFNYFDIHIRLADGFNNHTIEYILEQQTENTRWIIARAVLNDEGLIDDVIDSSHREHVLTHYLRLIQPVYDGLYRAINENTPVSSTLLQSHAVA